MGYYDREQAQWIAAPNGIVIAIVGESGGRAQLDVTGDGVADTGAKLTALGIDDAELAKLADLYDAGQEPLARGDHALHAVGLQLALRPARRRRRPRPGRPGRRRPAGDDPCGAGGSIILCENQVLGEQAAIAGTPYVLVYQSDRVPGRRTGDSLEIPLTGADAARVARPRRPRRSRSPGARSRSPFARAANLKYTFIFDGLDAYGRPVAGPPEGRRQDRLRLRRGLPRAGRVRSSFAASAAQTISGNRTRQEISVSQRWSGDRSAGSTRRRARSRAGASTSTTPTTRSGARSTSATAPSAAPRARTSTSSRPRSPASRARRARGRRRTGRCSSPTRRPHVVRRIAPDGDDDDRRGHRRRRLQRRRRPGDRGPARPPGRRGARPRRLDPDRRRGQQPDPPDRARRA